MRPKPPSLNPRDDLRLGHYRGRSRQTRAARSRSRSQSCEGDTATRGRHAASLIRLYEGAGGLAADPVPFRPVAGGAPNTYVARALRHRYLHDPREPLYPLVRAIGEDDGRPVRATGRELRRGDARQLLGRVDTDTVRARLARRDSGG